VRPTQQGTAIAKDSWLLGIGAALLVDAAQSGEGLGTLVRGCCSSEPDGVADNEA